MNVAASILTSLTPKFRTPAVVVALALGLVPITWAGAPSISTVAEQNISANQTSAPIGFTVDDAETAAGDLVVTASSSDQALVSDGGLVVGGSGGARTLTVTPASSRTGVATVTLTVSDGGAETVSTSFLLSVGVPVSGLRREIYRGLNGWMLSELFNSPNYPDSPDLIAFSPAFETPSEEGDLYGQRLTTYLRPPVSGDYVFYVASDDGSELYLSLNEDPRNKVRIAAEPAWSGWRAWVDAGSQQVHRGDPPANISSPIALEAGKIYYMEMLHVEGWGGDKAAVTWQLPGLPPPINGAPPIPGRYLSSLVPEAPEVVTFPDSNLEAAVREALDKRTGPIYRIEVEGLSDLNATDRGIVNLSGLEAAVNLRRLWLNQNQITDLTPLAGLVRLELLFLGSNRPSSLEPLANLSQLRELDLNDTGLTDFSSLTAARFPQLSRLFLERNGITSLESAQHWPLLTGLWIGVNQVSDLRPLSAQTQLQVLACAFNWVSDLSPLVSLPALQRLECQYNYLDISAGSPARAVVEMIEARPSGEVIFEPQNGLPGGLNTLASRSFFAGSSVPAFAFTAGDPARAANIVSVTAHSSNQTVVADDVIVLRGLGAVHSLALKTSPDTAGTTTLTVTVQYSSGPPATASFTVTTYPGGPGTRYIETEDFDFDGGQHLAVADVMPYLGGAYEGKGAVHGVDYLLPFVAPGGPILTDPYRAPADPRVAVNAKGSLAREGYTMQRNLWNIWNQAGNWFNYTRGFPPGFYHVYANVINPWDRHVQLDEVARGRGTAVQSLRKLGTFDRPGNGSWEVPDLVPLRNSDGSLARVYLSGERTLRWTELPNQVGEMDYLAFVPAPDSDPGIAAQPADQFVNVGDTATFTIEPIGTAPFTLQWRKNGVDLPGQTGTSLTLDNVQLADIGEYSVVVSNGAGTFTSSPILLRFHFSTPVTLADANLEAAVRQAINKPTGTLTVEDLERLTELMATNRGIASLSGLECAVNLRRLWLNQNQITDVSPIAGLTGLIALNLENNRITSVAGLEGLVGLNVLYVNWNQISEIGPLHGMTRLQALGLGGNPLSAISVVGNFTGLSYLNIQWLRISELSALNGLVHLQNLFVDGNRLPSLASLPGLPELTELSVNNTGITDYSALTGARFPKLNRLIAEVNGIRSLDFLAHLPQLRDLAVSWNQISDIRPVLAHPGLRLFNFGGNWVSDISALASLPDLVSCFCPYNFLDLTPGSAARSVLDLLSGRPNADIYYTPQNALPGGLSQLPSQMVLAGQTIPTFPFTAGDPARAAEILSVTASSSNPEVLANEDIEIDGFGSVRAVGLRTISGDGGTTTVTVTVNYTSDPSESGSFTVSALPTGPQTLFIEAEDFDFGRGQSVRDVAIGMTGPYPGGSFEGRGDAADAGIDWGTTGGSAGQPYRSATGVAAGKRNQSTDDLSRGAFDVEVNHVVGWNDAGDWMNYTREFPRGIYEIYGRFSSGGLDERAQLDLVTDGVGTPDQSLTRLGTFDAPPTGGWDSFHLVPMRAESGELSRVVLNGEQTLRFTVLPGNMDFDYLVFVPRNVAPVPDEATLQPVSGECPFTLTARPTATDDLDGVVTGTTVDSLTFQSPGTHSVRWTFTDTAGNTASAVQTVTVSDHSAPVIVCPADLQIGCSVEPLVPVTFGVTASDACDPAPVVVSSPPSGTGFPIGTTTVQCTARDASGNETQCSFSVTRDALGFSGFNSPIGGADATGGSFASPLRTFRAGANITVRFSATCNGAPVVTGIHRLSVRKWTTASSSVPVTLKGSDEFRVLGGDWVLSVETKGPDFGPGIYQLIATLSDGSSHTAWIRLR